MKTGKILAMVIICCLIGFSQTKLISGLTGATENYVPDPDGFYGFSLSAETNGSWIEGNVHEVSLNFTVIKLPADQISGIRIVAVVVSLVDSSNTIISGQTAARFDNTIVYREINNSEYFVADVISPPTTVNTFRVNITINLVTLGNHSQDLNNSPQYSYFLPDEIILNKIETPLVNLYGFPPGKFLFEWLFVIVPALIVILSPVFYSIGWNLLQVRKKRKESKLNKNKSEEIE